MDIPITLYAGTPVERIDDLIAQIQALKAAGALNGGDANALISTLLAAKINLENGLINTAINQMQAFINAVNAYILGGILTPQQGGDLMADAEVIIYLLESSQLASSRHDLHLVCCGCLFGQCCFRRHRQSSREFDSQFEL